MYNRRRYNQYCRPVCDCAEASDRSCNCSNNMMNNSINPNSMNYNTVSSNSMKNNWNMKVCVKPNIYEDACTCSGNMSDYFQNNSDDECGCGLNESSVFPMNPMYGQAYVPIQQMGRTFTPCVGLKMGTIFPELVSPYSPCQSIEENAFIEAKNKIGEGCNDGQCTR